MIIIFNIKLNKKIKISKKMIQKIITRDEIPEDIIPMSYTHGGNFSEAKLYVPFCKRDRTQCFQNYTKACGCKHYIEYLIEEK